MDFYQRYELIDPLPGEGTRSFRARQIVTGREVAVHLLVGRTPENEALLTRLRTLPEGSLRKLIEVGDNDGTTFVAVEAPPFLHLAEWLTEQERTSVAEAMKYTRAGSWKIPVAPLAPAPPVAPPVVSPAPASSAPSSGPGEFTRMFQQGGASVPPPVTAEPGEFTRQFQASQAPAAPPIPQRESPDLSVTKTMAIPVPRNLPDVPKPASPPPPPVATTPAAGEFTRMFQAAGSAPAETAPVQPPPPAPVRPAAAQPGEFTRMFEAPKVTPEPALPTPPAPAAVPASPAASATPQAGEFTRMFQSPPTAATPEPLPPPPPAKPSGPGEFTRVFNAQLPSAPAQGDWPAPAPKPAQAGEFTRMFKSPEAPTEPAPEQQASGGGEFTRMFNAGRPSPAPGPQFPSPSAFPTPQPQASAPAAPSHPGDFTQMFGRPGSAAPASPPPQAPMQPNFGGGGTGSGATGAFRTPAPAPPPPGVQQGPSEYTQMMRAPSSGAQAQTPQAGAATHAPQMQMPQMPQMQMPQAPQIQVPHVSMTPPPMPKLPDQVPAKAPGMNMVLIAILLLAAFLIGAVAMVFLLKKDTPKPHAGAVVNPQVAWETSGPTFGCRAPGHRQLSEATLAL